MKSITSLKSSCQIITILVLVTFLILVLSSCLYAQGTNKIVGKVVDKDTGEPLPGVNVIISGTFLGAATDINGQYFILNVPVGTYTLEASMIGYKKLVKTSVRVEINRTTQVNFQMEATVIEGEEVTVVAEKDDLHIEVASSQIVTSSETISEAANVRSVGDFLKKQAGIGSRLEIRGGSSEQTGTIVEGIEYVDHLKGRTEITLPMSAVEQVAIQSGGFTADQGNYRSGLINVALKKGNTRKYSGSLSIQRNDAQMKRFGSTLFGADNYYNRQFASPEIAFIGTKDYYNNLYPNDETERKYRIQQQYVQFNGWINEAEKRWNPGKSDEQKLTPLELFLWHNWMTTTNPDWNRLRAQVNANPEIVHIDGEAREGRGFDDVITSELKKAFEEHANREAGGCDFLIDGGFGGPVPFIDNLNFLQNSTFYLAYRGARQYYTQPGYYEYQLDHSGTLTLSTYINKNLHLRLNNLYRYTRGLDQSGMDRTDFDIEDPTQDYSYLMPVENADRWFKYNKGKERRVYLNTWYHPKEIEVWANGLQLDYFFNKKTFMNFKFSHTLNTSYSYPDYDRDRSVKVSFGPVRLDERPYGYKDSLTYVLDGWPLDDNLDRLPAPLQINNLFRYASKNGDVVDRSKTRQIKLNLDINSQVNYNNLLKAGLEFNYIDMMNSYFMYAGTRYEQVFEQAIDYSFHKKPIQVAAYVQDQLTYKGIIANLGLRMDYYRPGGKWFNFDAQKWNSDLFPSPTGAGLSQTDFIDYMYDNEDNWIWNYWEGAADSIDNVFTDIKSHLVFSPRLGVSFPVSDKMKYYFNYGHFRQQPLYYRMFQLNTNVTGGLGQLGNPNMEPARTIFYETGVEYLFGNTLIKIAGYYKDVTGQHGEYVYQAKPETGIPAYNSHVNNNYQDQMGVELNLQRSYGEWVLGWLNFDYAIRRSGNTGRQTHFEDADREILEGFYEGNESRSVPRPRAAGNIRFKIPNKFGRFLGDWDLSIFATWRRGSYFTWNPGGIPGVNNNLHWPDYYMLDMKLSKLVDLKPLKMELFVNIDNPFNIKNLNIPNAFRAFSSDDPNYLASLRLPMYDDPLYDGLRASNEGLPENEWKYVAGNDKVGDLRSEDKPYINDPDLDLLYYLERRQIWFGINIFF